MEAIGTAQDITFGRSVAGCHVIFGRAWKIGFIGPLVVGDIVFFEFFCPGIEKVNVVAIAEYLYIVGL